MPVMGGVPESAPFASRSGGPASPGPALQAGDLSGLPHAVEHEEVLAGGPGGITSNGQGYQHSWQAGEHRSSCALMGCTHLSEISKCSSKGHAENC